MSTATATLFQPLTVATAPEWGGSVANRARFLLSITDAVIGVWGADRVGIRLSPTNQHGDIEDNNPWETYSFTVEQLNQRQPAYIHLVSPRVSGNMDVTNQLDLGPNRFRPLITGDTRLIAAGGYEPADAEHLLRSGDADAVAFGRLFLANPDLPHRIAVNAGLNAYDRSTFYTRGTEGYTDYPTLQQLKAATRQEAKYVEVER